MNDIVLAFGFRIGAPFLHDVGAQRANAAGGFQVALALVEDEDVGAGEQAAAALRTALLFGVGPCLVVSALIAIFAADLRP